MPINITPDIERQLREFEQQLTSNEDVRNQWIGGNAPYRSMTEALTNRLFDLLGPSQASSTYRRRFTDNPFALQSGYTASTYARGVQDQARRDLFETPGKYEITDFLKEQVPSGSAFIDPRTARGIFSSLPQDVLGRTSTNEATYQLTQMNPGQLYDLYAAGYTPTASALEQRRRANEQTDVLRRLENVQGGDVGELQFFQGMSAGVDFAKYNQNVAPALQNLGANYLQTIQTAAPAYYQSLVSWAANNDLDMQDIAQMTTGQILAAQASYWQGGQGSRDPNRAKAFAFSQQYGYFPSILEAQSGKPFTGPSEFLTPPGIQPPPSGRIF